jgi:hypothetical protein
LSRAVKKRTWPYRRRALERGYLVLERVLDMLIQLEEDWLKDFIQEEAAVFTADNMVVTLD